MRRIAFQMDRGVVVGRDVSVKFMEEGERRGYQILFYQAHDLALLNGKLIAWMFPVHVTEDSLCFGEKIRVELESLDMLFIRQNPPFDMRYVTNTYLLEKLQRVLLINDPKAIRDNPEKIFPLSFPDFIPPTLITENPEEIGAFYREFGDVVLKPLYDYGGTGVVRISGDMDINTTACAMIERYNAPVVMQKFIPAIEQDKRVVLLSGKIIGAIRRRVSRKDEIRTNLRIGSIPEVVELSGRDYEICDAIGGKLVESGIEFAGIDILGDFLIEVNVTSPCGILEINQIYGTTLERDCWDRFEYILHGGSSKLRSCT